MQCQYQRRCAGNRQTGARDFGYARCNQLKDQAAIQAVDVALAARERAKYAQAGVRGHQVNVVGVCKDGPGGRLKVVRQNFGSGSIEGGLIAGVDRPRVRSNLCYDLLTAIGGRIDG